jgi:hypothetical protein
MVRFFRQIIALEDAIGSHTCCEASMRVVNSIACRVATASNHYHHEFCRSSEGGKGPGFEFDPLQG